MECPYCKEEIQSGALKCKHCGSMLEVQRGPEVSGNPLSYYLGGFKKYASFKGRARRKEYWYFFLFHVLVSIVLGFVDGVIGTYSPEAGIGLLGAVYSLAVLIPGVAISVRRLHDTNRSGWWLLIGLVPIIGAIVLLVFFVQESKLDDNKYGISPKLVAA